jgi:pyroglutamyl-peptidase
MILVTAFEPYDRSPINPADLVLKQLPDVIGKTRLQKVTIACDSIQAPSRVTELASNPIINTVVILGEDRRYRMPTLERFAYNWLEYEVPDNLGRQPKNTSIVPQGPTFLVSHVDIKMICLVLSRQGIVVNVSDDPGRHLCNHVYYTVRYHTDPKVALLFHLPRLPEQQLYPSLRLTDSLRATLGLLEYLSSTIEGQYKL